jgi:hypothetical protein
VTDPRAVRPDLDETEREELEALREENTHMRGILLVQAGSRCPLCGCGVDRITTSTITPSHAPPPDLIPMIHTRMTCGCCGCQGSPEDFLLNLKEAAEVWKQSPYYKQSPSGQAEAEAEGG